MDFSLTPEQDEMRALTRQILSDKVSPTSGTATDYDLDLWRVLAEAGLVGIGMPASAGGFGGDFLDVCVVLEEIGRAAAPVPALPVMAVAGPALARFGDADDLAGVAAGDRIVTAAIDEPTGNPFHPGVVGDGGRLTGVKVCVAAGTIADAFVVTADDGLYLVDAGADGLTAERAETTSGLPDAMVTFTRTPARKLAGPAAVGPLLDHAVAAQCIVMAGVAQAALDLTAAYTKERKQFDRVLATFQAVSQRAGDARIDTEAIRLTAWQAAWLLTEGLPAAAEVAVAKFWAADGGQRVVHAAAHLHGGIGLDRSYPLHRYFLWAKQLELALGGATPSLVRLGGLLADEPVA